MSEITFNLRVGGEKNKNSTSFEKKITMKVDRVLANHYLSSTASLWDLPTFPFIISSLGINRQAQIWYKIATRIHMEATTLQESCEDQDNCCQDFSTSDLILNVMQRQTIHR